MRVGNRSAAKAKGPKNAVADRHPVLKPASAHSSESRVRLTARIKRDRPDIGERLDAGKFTSVRAAAVEAGIIKKVDEVDKTRKALGKLPRAVAMAVIADYLGCEVEAIKGMRSKRPIRNISFLKNLELVGLLESEILRGFLNHGWNCVLILLRLSGCRISVAVCRLA